LKVSLTDHRKISGQSALRIRILVHVEEYCNDDTLAAPETWFVHADKLIEVLQASPAFVDGLSHIVVLLTGGIKPIFKGPARLSTLECGTDPNAVVYDVFAMINEASNAISTPYPIKVVSNGVEVHVLEVSSSV
jgi:hypothetical protein